MSNQSTSQRASKMPLEKHISSFQVAKRIKDYTAQISSMDFSQDGLQLVSCSQDNSSIRVYDCLKGTQKQLVHCNKYGSGLIKFTKDDLVIHSSTKGDDSVRLLDLTKNNYKRYFSGHSNKVIALCPSPTNSAFISGSNDNTIRLWDYGSPTARGLMKFDSRPVVNYDPDGVIFAVGINSESVKLYDIRFYKKGPFNVFKIPQNMVGNWTSLKFSPNGKSIMINTSNSLIHIIDAYTGEPLYESLDAKLAPGCHSLEASFTPDSEFIFSGTDNGQSIRFWKHLTGEFCLNLKSDHKTPVKCVEFNPKFLMFASACKELYFWIPAIYN